MFGPLDGGSVDSRIVFASEPVGPPFESPCLFVCRLVIPHLLVCLFATPHLLVCLFATPHLLVYFSQTLRPSFDLPACLFLFVYPSLCAHYSYSKCCLLHFYCPFWVRLHAPFSLSLCSFLFASFALLCRSASQTWPTRFAERDQYPFPFRSISQILHFVTFFNSRIPSFQY